MKIKYKYPNIVLNTGLHIYLYIKSFVSMSQRGAPTYTLTSLLHFGRQSFSEMEARLCHVSEQLSEQTELQRSVIQRAQLAEQQVQDLRERLQGVETELLTADMQRDGLRHGKQHVSEVICWHRKRCHRYSYICTSI